MDGDTTDESSPGAKHAAELHRLAQQLRTLRPGTQPPTLLAERAATSAVDKAVRGQSHDRARGAGGQAMATVLPFRRPHVDDPASEGDEPGPRHRGDRVSSAGARSPQTSAERRERKAAKQRKAAEVFADQLAADPEEVTRDLCLGWLAVRPHTRSELATKCKRKGVPLEVVANVLDRYAEVGLIDDAAFAHTYVESRQSGRGLAKRALAYELRSRGVDAATTELAVSRIEPSDEEARARVLVTRRLAGLGHVPVEARARRLMGMLARKGYPGGMAAAVVRDAMAAAGAALPDDDLEV